MDDYSDYSDSYSYSEERRHHSRKGKTKTKNLSRRQQVINNFMNGIVDPEYLCKPNKKKPGQFIVSKRKKPLDIPPPNPAPIIQAQTLEPPTPPPPKEEKPVEKSDSSKQTHDLLSKYIQNQDTINQSFNNAIMDLKDTMIKMEKKKQQRKKREVKKSLEKTRKTKLPDESKPEEPTPSQEYQPAPNQMMYRRYRPRDLINFNPAFR